MRNTFVMLVVVGLTVIAVGTASAAKPQPKPGKGPAAAKPDPKPVAARPESQPGPEPQAACDGADSLPTAATVSDARRAVICLVNQARGDIDARDLRADDDLRDAAQGHARALGPSRPLDDTGPDGSTPETRIAHSGYARHNAFTFGEVLGRAFGDKATPATRVDAWLGSSAGRLLLSCDLRDAGVGISVSGDRVTYVLDLAAKRTAKASSKRASGSSSRAPKSSRSCASR